MLEVNGRAAKLDGEYDDEDDDDEGIALVPQKKVI